MILSFPTAIAKRMRSSKPTGLITKSSDVGLPRLSGRVRCETLSLSNIQISGKERVVTNFPKHHEEGREESMDPHVPHLSAALDLWAVMGKFSGCGTESATLLRVSCQEAQLEKTIWSNNSNVG